QPVDDRAAVRDATTHRPATRPCRAGKGLSRRQARAPAEAGAGWCGCLRRRARRRRGRAAAAAAPQEEETLGPATMTAGERHGEGPMAEELEPAEALEELLEEVVEGLGLDVEIEVEEGPGVLSGRIRGEDVGLFIGRHGQTIDAVQHLAQRIVFPGGP